MIFMVNDKRIEIKFRNNSYCSSKNIEFMERKS